MQQYYLIATTARAAQRTSSFTYHSSQALPVGQLVHVEVGKKILPGVVLRTVTKPSFKTKAITAVLPLPCLPQPLLKVGQWLTAYYHSHEATVWQTLLPSGLGKKRRAIKDSPLVQRDRTHIVLNQQQAAALALLNRSSPGTFLLQGITGSGKTQVYIEAAKQQLVEGKSTIILVPEIALTAQLIGEFSLHFNTIIATHSTMTEAQRYHAWERCLKSAEPVIVIGPRSALFSPVTNVGLIVIDECHEPSFKQESMPRYSALRAASVLAAEHKAFLLLGSATPSVVDRYLAEKSDRPLMRLTSLARSDAQPPEVTIIDMTKTDLFTRHRFLSNALLSSIQKSLEAQQQALLFHNRRGDAPTTLCKTCGWLALCRDCHLPLTLHNDAFHLKCHACNASQKVPTSCPDCGTTDVIHKGIGTKAIEEALRRFFPKARIHRFDADTAASDTVEKLYSELYNGQVDIIIGTQVIAKGLDLPRLTTVGIIQADSGLALPDFQSGERVFQLISQVRGRIGRTKNPSTLIVQTFRPADQSIVAGVRQDYEAFYAATLAQRQQQFFPPFCHLLKLVCSYKTEATAIKAARTLASILRKSPLAITVLGPAPAFYERLRGSYRWQLIIKSHDRRQLIAALEHLPAQHWQFEIDPISLL